MSVFKTVLIFITEFKFIFQLNGRGVILPTVRRNRRSAVHAATAADDADATAGHVRRRGIRTRDGPGSDG